MNWCKFIDQTDDLSQKRDKVNCTKLPFNSDGHKSADSKKEFRNCKEYSTSFPPVSEEVC